MRLRGRALESSLASRRSATAEMRSARARRKRAPAPLSNAETSQREGAMPRIERDFLGEKVLPDSAYYGVQTLRGKENFNITGIPMSTEPYFVKAFGYVKKAAALAK